MSIPWKDHQRHRRVAYKVRTTREIHGWIYQHSILPRILWPLLVFEVPMTTVESMERRISSYLHRWLGLPHNLSSMTLYGSSKQVKKTSSWWRTREALLYRDSMDPKVSAAETEVRTGRKWKPCEALEVEEARQRQRETVGNIARCHTVFGYFPII